ncbi:unnamed protein product [Acanthoscelides obtectus]|uniref:Uncharacterized protein n=1 Tax=Acanthoscelides obtectus TaxID=200917 RepID=A0A9P0PEA5_ACAOB|nr:unnamed protein product [Acanthoscelides obtectus]CAK1646379.1 hypothetical protein AOBTE_LOCUS14606 [Acanthoscelides obtectus]
MEAYRKRGLKKCVVPGCTYIHFQNMMPLYSTNGSSMYEIQFWTMKVTNKFIKDFWCVTYIFRKVIKCLDPREV